MNNIQSPAGDDDQSIEREILAKGKTAPRITPARINEVIHGAYYFSALDGATAEGVHAQSNGDEGDAIPEALSLLTFCVLVLENGFTVTGESACASPENFNNEIGRKIAFENAKQKIWALEGYQLKTQLHEAAIRDTVTTRLEG